MKSALKHITILAAATLTATVGQAQIYKLKGASVSVGATGPFTTALQTNPSNVSYVANNTGGGLLNETASGQQQFTTLSVGFLSSLQFHPAAWAGIEVNYGFNHYSEVFRYNASSATTAQTQHVNTYAHEATAAYMFHPKHIKFQPFLNVGGGAISFLPGLPMAADNQWRWTGLLETGFDIPSGSPHLAFRVAGRSLIYRAPNFYNSAISTRTWRSTEEPTTSAVFRF